MGGIEIPPVTGPLRFSMRLPFFALLIISTASATAAQQQPTTKHAIPHDAGFMQAGMHPATAAGVTLDASSTASSHTITLRIGPMNLPANTSHMKMPQPPDLVWTIPITGWLLAYHPKLIDSAGNSVPGAVLHHVAFWNENRSDFLCPNKEEHIFGAGGELTDWAQIPGFGYPVEKGDQIRIETMIHNPTATSYEKVYLEVSIPYAASADATSANKDGSPDNAPAAPLKNFYPAWMDVAACGNSGYDLLPGPSKKVGSVRVNYPGILLGVGGHMHDYGQQLILEDSTANSAQHSSPAKSSIGPNMKNADAEKISIAKTNATKTSAAKTNLENANIEKASVGKTNVDQVEKASSEKTNADKVEKMNGEKKIVATLAAKLDSQGHLLSIPVVTFFQTGGYPFTSADTLTITATYNNPTNNLLRNGAMGIVVGYFVPQDPAALNNLRHPAHASPLDMSHMSHEH